MLKRRDKLTVAAIVSRPGAAETVSAVEALASSLAQDWEVLLVARRLPASDVMALTRAVQQVPDATLHILEDLASEEAAQLAALDMAIGDRVLLVDPFDLQPEACERMVEMADNGYEVVLGRRADRAHPSVTYGLCRRLFARAYSLLTGVAIENELPRAALYSRAAALHLLSRREAEMLLRSTSLGEAFPTAAVELAPTVRETGSRHRERPMRAVMRAYRALNFTGALPLRLVVLLCGTSAVINVLYMTYVIVSRLIEDDVQPGWATLSLQVSGMFLLLSIVLGIIAEHLIAVDRAVNRRPRYIVLREVRSPLSKAWKARNVVGAEVDA